MTEETSKKEIIFTDRDGTLHRAETLEEWLREAFFRGDRDTIAKLMKTLPEASQEKYREFLKDLIRQRSIEGGV